MADVADAPLPGTRREATGRARLGGGTAARLTRYLHILVQARKAGASSISSQEIGDHASVNPTQIRRDLSGLGRLGTRGVGYDVDHLIGALRQALGVSGPHTLVVVGAGRLGESIATSDVFEDHDFRIAAVFDADPAKVGRRLGGVAVRSPDSLSGVVRSEGVLAAVLAVPAEAAQEWTDQLVEAGVRAIVNYTDMLLVTPPQVAVVRADPAAELLHALHAHGVG
jgi:redox-sensing transcriptional repressor